MKVALIYRQPAPGAFSIERLFRTIARHLRGVEVVEYVMSGRARLLSDVRRIRKLDADIYHVTGDVNYVVPLLPRGKTVLTVHDIGHYLHGLRGLKRVVYKWIWFTLPLRCASAVTCVSPETARNLHVHFRLTERKVHIIDNCLTAAVSPTTREFNSQSPRILQVGTRPYKNVPRLIEALVGIPCTLVLVGAIDASIREALDKSQVKHESHVGVTDAALVDLYGHCDMVAFASTGEGFGLPIIEAQAAARPLVTSDVLPLSEVAGAGACLVNPLDVVSIRGGLRRIIDDADYRHSVVQAGLANAGRYSPWLVASSYRDVYDTICFSGGRSAA